MKKKIAAMLVIMSLACIQLAGCGQEEKKTEDNKKTETVESKTEKKSETKKDNKKTEKKDSNETDKKITDVKRGTIADGMYKNESFGVSFPVASNMIACTDEQIAQTLNLGTDFLENQETYTAETMEDVMEGALYDTIILFSDNSSSVSVIYEDMDKADSISITEEQYLKAVGNSLTSLNMGYEVEEPTTQDIGGTEFASMTSKTSQYQQTYCIHKVGNYMIEFIFTYTDATEQEVNNLSHRLHLRVRYKKNEIVKRMGIIPSFFDTIFLQSQSIRKVPWKSCRESQWTSASNPF